jgi:hypothetical protein
MAMLSASQSFAASAVSKTPEGPGVYKCVCGEVTTYIGFAGAEGIRKNLQEHTSGKRGSCTQISTSFVCQEHDDPEARCKELIAEHVAMHGSLPRCNR